MEASHRIPRDMRLINMLYLNMLKNVSPTILREAVTAIDTADALVSYAQQYLITISIISFQRQCVNPLIAILSLINTAAIRSFYILNY